MATAEVDPGPSPRHSVGAGEPGWRDTFALVAQLAETKGRRLVPEVVQGLSREGSSPARAAPAQGPGGPSAEMGRI